MKGAATIMDDTVETSQQARAIKFVRERLSEARKKGVSVDELTQTVGTQFPEIVGRKFGPVLVGVRARKHEGRYYLSEYFPTTPPPAEPSVRNYELPSMSVTVKEGRKKIYEGPASKVTIYPPGHNNNNTPPTRRRGSK